MIETKTRSHPLKGLDLNASDRIIYKMTVRDRSLVPAGLREGARKSDKVVDQKHAEAAIAAGQKKEAELGRIRPNRVDTGMPVYQHEERVHIGSLRSLLAREGYWLEDAYFFIKQGMGNKPNEFVIVLVLSTETEKAMALPRSVMDGLRKLARESVWTAHVWDNSNTGSPATVNFVSRQQGSRQSTLVVRGDFLKIESIDGNVDDIESSEDQRIAKELLEALEEL